MIGTLMICCVLFWAFCSKSKIHEILNELRRQYLTGNLIWLPYQCTWKSPEKGEWERREEYYQEVKTPPSPPSPSPALLTNV